MKPVILMIKLDPDLHKKFKALLALEGKSMQVRVVELIKKDTEEKIERQK